MPETWNCQKQPLEMFCKKGVLKKAQWYFKTSPTQNRCFKKFTKFAAKNLCCSLFSIKLQFWGPATWLKKTPTQLLFCEIFKLFKNNYFEDYLWASASKHYLKRDSNTDAFLWILWIIQKHLLSRGSTSG